MRIRNDQLDRITRTKLRPFVVELIPHLREHFPDELSVMPDWELGEAIEDCLVRACGYGLTQRRDLARFAALAVGFGWSFDTEMEWPATMLRDEQLGPSERIEAVHERCLQQLEQRANEAALRRQLRI